MDLLAIIYILVASTIAFFIYSRWSYSYWKKRGIPFLEPEFPWGNTKDLFLRKSPIGLQIESLYKDIKGKGYKYGGYFSFFKPLFLPVDIEVIKCIMQKDFHHFVNHGMFVNEKTDPLSGHLFNLEDEKWRNLRSKLTPTFTSGKLKMMFPTLIDCTSGLYDILSSHAKLQDAMDVKEVICRFTTDVIGCCAFGIDCNSLKNPNSEFREFGKKIFAPSFWRLIKRSFMSMVPRKYATALGFKLTPQNVEDFFMNVVKNTIDYRETNNVFRKDFMHLLLQLKNRGEVSEDTNVTKEGATEKTGNYLSFEEIAAQCFVFFLAGFETSATTMTFALYELAGNKDIQDKLRDEINTVLEKHDGKITYEAINEMTYLDMVIHETLRKHPPVPASPRVCNKAYKIPGTEHVIERGTRLHIAIQAIHRDPEYYPNPEAFDPERFNVENSAKRPAFAFLPFGEGPRICIGARFGLMQVKVGLTAIIRKYQVSVSSKMKIPITYETSSFITSVEGGVWLNVHENQ